MTRNDLWSQVLSRFGHMQQKRAWTFVPEVEAVRQMIVNTISRERVKPWLPPTEAASEAILAAYNALPAAMRERMEAQEDATPFLDEQGKAAFRAVGNGLAFADVIMRTEHLAKLVKQNCGEDHPVRKAFAVYDLEQETTYAEAAFMLEAFDGLGEDEQRRILNGWYPKAWMTRADVLRMTDNCDDPMRVIEIDAHGQEVSASHDVLMRGRIAAVVVSIKEGSRKDDVVAELRSIMEMIDGQWDQLITSEFHRETKTAVKVASVPMLAGERNRAMASTAA